MRPSIFSTLATAVIAAVTAGVLSSCSTTEPEDEKPSEAIKEPVAQEPILEEPADQAAGWRHLKDDTNLPTDAQLADGADTSIGIGSPDDQDNTNPSTSIKPPPSEPEDRLDSTE